jgi:hypothetical protein
MDEAIAKFIEFVSTASPLVWAALIKQVYVEVFSMVAWGVGFAVIAFYLYRFGKKKQEEDDSDNEPIIVIAYIIVAACGLAAFGKLVSAIKWSINPEFYAIHLLLEKLGGG